MGLTVPEFSKERKLKVNYPALQTRQEEVVAPALKVAGKDPIPDPTTVRGDSQVNTRLVLESGTSQTGTLVDRSLLAAKRAHVARGPVEKPREAKVQALERPYATSCFLSGELGDKQVQFLVDTGCNTNLLSKHVFDKLPEQMKHSLEESKSHGTMADGTKLPFYGMVKLPLRVREIKTREVFVVSCIKEDAILGMPFLMAHNCSMEFSQPKMRIDGKRLRCTDKHGRLLAESVQANQKPEILPQTVGNREPSRSKRKPMVCRDYGNHPYKPGWSDKEVRANLMQACGETTPNKTDVIEPAPCRPAKPSYMGQIADKSIPNQGVKGRGSQSLTSETGAKKISWSNQKWPSLLDQRSDTGEPAVSRLSKLASGPPGPLGEKPQGHSTNCKRNQSHTPKNSVVIGHQKKGLFCEEYKYSQEVGEKTGSELSLTESADSREVSVKDIQINPKKRQIGDRHPISLEMNSTIENGENRADGESDSSLIKLLAELSDEEQLTTDSHLDFLNWSDQGLLSDSDTDTVAALEVAAQPVERNQDRTMANTMKGINTKPGGDKSQPEVILTNKKNKDISDSVLKVTEEMQIISINQVQTKSKSLKHIIPFKEMPKGQEVEKKAGMPGPARPAQSRDRNPVANRPALLEITENHDWFKDLDMSSSSASEAEEAIETRRASSPIVQPVLKVTGGQMGNGNLCDNSMTPKFNLGELFIDRNESKFENIDQFALKVANGQKSSSPPNTPCKISNPGIVSCVVEDNGRAETNKRIAVISPVRPPRAKRLRVELTRLDVVSDNTEADTAKNSRKVKRIPTVEWVSRKTKDLVEKAVTNGNACKLCPYQTSKRRIRIHVRQHFCMHFCQCGYRHTSRDQVADHQKTTRRAGHSRDQCRVYMVAEEEFPAFRQHMQWPNDKSFGELLPTTLSQSKVDVRPKPATTVKARELNIGVAPLNLEPGYQIPRKKEVPQPEPIEEPSQSQPEPPASSPIAHRALETPLPRDEVSKGRWWTQTKPQIQVVEVGSKNAVERILGRSNPSAAIGKLRAERATLLENDAEHLDDKARKVDATRRRTQLNVEDEQALREEARVLRTEANRLRDLADQLSQGR